MAIDISNLNNKVENEGTTTSGRLTADEWNKLVSAVGEVQSKVAGTIKGVTYNGVNYTTVKDGMLEMNVVTDSSGRDTKWEFIETPKTTISKSSSCIVKFNVIDQKPKTDGTSGFEPFNNPGKVIFYVDNKKVGEKNHLLSFFISNLFVDFNYHK